ncbi:MAG: hypothetical protein ACYSWP_12100 [Planctomycetota bacterium]|jgi:hypothetical protein
MLASAETKAKPINTIAGRGGIVSFRRNLRASVRGLWTGALSEAQALRTFRAAIERGIEQAWIEGAAECGIQPDELTTAELTKRDEFIFEQNDLAPNFVDAIEAQSKANGGKLQPLLQRNEMWVNQYDSAKQQSEALACANEKREWRVGRTEHCRTCLALNGQVRRMSFWLNNVMPRSAPNEKLECGGYRCQCILRKTDRPISRGRIPRLN